MTADIEQDLRQLFEADASHAPLPRGLADGARRRAHLQAKRQRRAAVLVCAGVAAVLVGGFAVLQRPSTDHSAPAATGSPDASAAVSSPSTSSSYGPVVPEKPALFFHNIEVPVPAAMLTGRFESGCPVADAAYVPTEAPTQPCARVVPATKDLTTVVLQPWTDHVDHSVGGTVSPGVQVLADGRTRVVSRIPSSVLQLIVTSPDPKRAQRLFDGLLIIRLAHGCQVQQAGQPTGPVPATGDPGGGSVCAYQDGWLVASAWLDNRQAEEMLRLLNAPKGSGPPVSCTPPSGTPPVEQWEVHLRLPAGEQVVDVPFDHCDQSPLTERLAELAPPPTDATRS